MDGDIVFGLIPLILGGTCGALILITGIQQLWPKTLNLGFPKLVINNYPLAVGGHLSGFVKIRSSDLSNRAKAKIKVGCDRRDHWQNEASATQLWVEEEKVEIDAQKKHSHVHFDFKIPPDLPSAENALPTRVTWWLELTVKDHLKRSVTKRYDHLGIFRSEEGVTVGNDTGSKLSKYSSIFVTNIVLFIGVFFYNWSAGMILLVILLEVALMTALSPLFVFWLVLKTDYHNNVVAQKGDAQKSDKSHTLKELLFRFLTTLALTVLFLVFGLIGIGAWSEIDFAGIIANETNPLSAVIAAITFYNMWLVVVAIIVSTIIGWIKVYERSDTVDFNELVKIVCNAPLKRMCLTFLLTLLLIMFLPKNEDFISKVLFGFLAFKVWIEYSLIKWGRLEV